jgi:GNAT superfamily N-acetyltransferase
MGRAGGRRPEVDIAVTDPRDPVACRCLQAYFTELARRFDDGFDPGLSIPADDAELTLPAGLLLLAELEAQAARHGARRLRLETNRNLTEAIALYRAAGYQEVAPFNDEAYAHHWFEKAVPGRR